MVGWVPSCFSSLQTGSVHASVLPLLFPMQMEVAKPARKLDKELDHIPPSRRNMAVYTFPLQGSEG